MPWKNTDSRYSSMSIALHWLMLVLLAVVYACIEFRGIFPKGSGGRTLIVEAHYMFGLTVFVLVWLRLLARTLGVAPKITPAPPAWQMLVSKLMHWALYLFMIATPILGWLLVSAQGHSVMFYGIELPALMGEDAAYAKQVKEWHELIASTGYWLIGLHALAGLFHHYFVRDNTLLRMLPKRNA
ncbi:cytochrome b [Pseudomonas sp. FEN]|uniref:cytochrome b n=1 Tax=Pseudomonas sp. FEN TaxID=2767468 RepID=UPI00174CBC63|nr:cytochrome b [Pseudomonas sp. FEN]